MANHSFQYDIYDPSHSVASQYWQMGVVASLVDGNNWHLVKDCVTKELPFREEKLFSCTKQDTEHAIWGCLHWKSAYWIYRFFLTGRDSFSRPGRYFFVLFKFNSLEQVPSSNIASIISYLGGQKAIPLDLKPLDNLGVISENASDDEFNIFIKTPLPDASDELKLIFEKAQSLSENSHIAFILKQKKVVKEYRCLVIPRERENIKLPRPPHDEEWENKKKAFLPPPVVPERLPSRTRSKWLVVPLASAIIIGIISGFILGKYYSKKDDDEAGTRTRIQIVNDMALEEGKNLQELGGQKDNLIRIPMPISKNMVIVANKPVFWLYYTIVQPKKKRTVKIELQSSGASPFNIKWEVDGQEISRKSENKLIIELDVENHEVSATYNYTNRSNSILTETVSITIPAEKKKIRRQ